MDPQPPTPALHLFKELRTDTSCPAGSLVQIHISEPSTFSVRQRQTRHVPRSSHAFDSPDTFSKHYGATSASVFHSSSSRFPRSFLWRIVQDQKVLEVRAVDLSSDVDESRDVCYTIQLHIDSQLRHGAISLAEDDDASVIYIFALAKSNEIYTIALPKAFFSSLKASEEDVSRWCSVIQPAPFSISAPHSLHAANPSELIVTLCDGRLLLLTRKSANDNSQWNTTIYGDGNWTTSLRGLVKWQGSNTVRHDGNVLEQNTALSLAVSPDKKHIIAVSLNHQLRIWNISTGSIVFSKDVLGQHRDQDEVQKYMNDPHNASYLQILKLSGSSQGWKYCALVFSPHNDGEFKFWGVRDADFSENGVKDAFPDFRFLLPNPDTFPQNNTVWTLVDFKVSTDVQDQQVDLWALMQIDRQYKVYNLRCDFSSLPDAWMTKWICTANYGNNDDLLPLSASDVAVMGEEWLNYILAPLRYPEAVIESGLLTYRTGHHMVVGDTKVPLRRRLRAAVEHQASKTTIHEDSENRHLAIYHEWVNLWQYIRDFNSLRHSALSISLDSQGDLPWITHSDGCSVIRNCTRLETISCNTSDVLAIPHDRIEMPSVEMDTEDEPKLPDELAVLLGAASALRMSFSPQLRQSSRAALSIELWEESSSDMPARMEAFARRSDLETELGDESLNQLDKNLERIGGLRVLDTDAFFAITDDFYSIFSATEKSLQYSKFGLRTLICGARDMIYHRQSMLFDLFACVVVATTEVDEDMPYFNGPQIFERLLELLKQYEVMRWLVEHTNIDAENERGQKPGIQSARESYIDWKPTALETIFAKYLRPQSAESQTSSEALTHSLEDLLRWIMGGKDDVTIAEVVVHVQCHLLKSRNITLATDFQRFQPSTPWAMYLKGRLALLKREPDEAASLFQPAGTKLSNSANINKHDLHDLLSDEEALHFGQGLPNYYSHIIDLFADAVPPHSASAAQFADLALKKLPDNDQSEQSTDLLKSLFTASLQTGDFTTAHSALTRHPSPQTLLPDFITKTLSTPGGPPLLLTLSWPQNLHRPIDNLLQQLAEPKQLAAWRLHHDDFKGAAAALLPSLNTLQARARRSAADEEKLENEYLTIINLLECAGRENAWVFSRGSSGVEEQRNNHRRGSHVAPEREKRRVVTLDDLREAYQKELDRRSAVEGGRYAFANGNIDEGDGDVMDLL